MKSLKFRSDEPEMMDDPATDRQLLFKNLAELDTMNRVSGGHAIILQGVKKLIRDNRLYHIADLGCGSGDTLKYIAQWARKNNFRFRLTGVDKNIHAINYLKRKCSGFPEISGVVMDYSEYMKSVGDVDIYICSLFCHHLDNQRLQELFRLLKKAKTGFVVSDLQRSAFAYYAVWGLTRMLNGTVLSKNDGPISVLRAFKRHELELLLRESGISHFRIKWKWAFRYRIIVKNV